MVNHRQVLKQPYFTSKVVDRRVGELNFGKVHSINS